MRSMRGHLVSRAMAAACGLLVPITGVSAHPHMWVTVQTTVLFEKGAFTGLREKWTFDEFYAAFAIQGLDKNHDGIYDREELSELAKVNIDAMKEVGYFTYPVLAGEALKLKDAQDYYLEHKDGILSLYFTVLFEQPVLTEAKGLGYAVEDPTFYIAFSPAKADPVNFADGSPKSCTAHIGNQGGSGNAEQLASAFARVATPISASRAVLIDCAGQ